MTVVQGCRWDEEDITFLGGGIQTKRNINKDQNLFMEIPLISFPVEWINTPEPVAACAADMLPDLRDWLPLPCTTEEDAYISGFVAKAFSLPFMYKCVPYLVGIHKCRKNCRRSPSDKSMSFYERDVEVDYKLPFEATWNCELTTSPYMDGTVFVRATEDMPAGTTLRVSPFVYILDGHIDNTLPCRDNLDEIMYRMADTHALDLLLSTYMKGDPTIEVVTSLYIHVIHTLADIKMRAIDEEEQNEDEASWAFETVSGRVCDILHMHDVQVTHTYEVHDDDVRDYARKLEVRAEMGLEEAEYKLHHVCCS